MRGKHQMTKLSQSELSDDIIFEEILTRLPVQSVVRFKSVSKKWYSTLSSSNFATAHLNKSPFSGPCAPLHTLFIERSTESYFPEDNIPSYYLLPFDDNNRISGDLENDLVKLDVDFGDDNLVLEVVGSCNGLICFTPTSIDCAHFYLWNPSTRKLNKYVGLQTQKPPRDIRDRIACGFGYVSVVDDYKFVRIITRFGTDRPHPSIVHVFSCRSNKWTQLDCDLGAYFIGFRASLVNEKLYWPSLAIISFDLGLEKFNIFHYPNSTMGPLGIMGECLCKVAGDGMIDILMPPTILKSMTLPKDLQFGYGYGIVGFTRDGKFFVSGDFHDELSNRVPSTMLWLVNTDVKPLECSKLMELEGCFRMFRYVPSLISPFLLVEP